MIGTLRTLSGATVSTSGGVPLLAWVMPLPPAAPVYSAPVSTEPLPYPPQAVLTSFGIPLRTGRGALLLVGRLPLPALVPILPDPQATMVAQPSALRTARRIRLLTSLGALVLPGFIPFPGTRVSIVGVTRDLNGATLAGCAVALYLTRNDALVDRVTSDASGNYTFTTTGLGETYYVVAYLAGTPDVAGTTVNTLTGA